MHLSFALFGAVLLLAVAHAETIIREEPNPSFMLKAPHANPSIKVPLSFRAKDASFYVSFLKAWPTENISTKERVNIIGCFSSKQEKVFIAQNPETLKVTEIRASETSTPKQIQELCEIHEGRGLTLRLGTDARYYQQDCSSSVTKIQNKTCLATATHCLINNQTFMEFNKLKPQNYRAQKSKYFASLEIENLVRDYKSEGIGVDAIPISEVFQYEDFSCVVLDANRSKELQAHVVPLCPNFSQDELSTKTLAFQGFPQQNQQCYTSISDSYRNCSVRSDPDCFDRISIDSSPCKNLRGMSGGPVYLQNPNGSDRCLFAVNAEWETLSFLLFSKGNKLSGAVIDPQKLRLIKK